jgi:hypothetical protein
MEEEDLDNPNTYWRNYWREKYKQKSDKHHRSVVQMPPPPINYVMPLSTPNYYPPHPAMPYMPPPMMAPYHPYHSYVAPYPMIPSPIQLPQPFPVHMRQ